MTKLQKLEKKYDRCFDVVCKVIGFIFRLFFDHLLAWLIIGGALTVIVLLTRYELFAMHVLYNIGK